MTQLKPRVVRLEKTNSEATKAAIDAWLEALTDEELEAIVRGTASDIRTGKMCGEQLKEYCRLAEIEKEGGLTVWLETVPVLQPGDAELLERLYAEMPK